MSRKSTSRRGTRSKISSTPERDISNAVRTYNAKITRISKSRPELIPFLPEYANAKQIKEELWSDGKLDKREALKKLNSLDRFLEKGAEETVKNKHGLEVSKYELQENRLAIKRINEQRRVRRKLEENEMKQSGKGLNYSRKEMGLARSKSLAPKEFNFDAMIPRDYSKFKEGLKLLDKSNYYKERDNFLKENYTKKLKEMFNSSGDALVKKIEKMSTKDFIKTYYSDVTADMDFIYSPEDANTILNSLKGSFGVEE